MMTRYFIIALLCIARTVTFAMTDLEKAAGYYQKQDYSSALSTYLDLADTHPHNIDLMYNIGNSYFKLKQYGYAIAYYRKALKWNPLDDDIRYNLDIARNFVVDERQDSSFLQGFWQKRRALSINQLFYLSSSLLLMLIGLLLARRSGYNTALLTNVIAVNAVLLAFFITWFALSSLSYSSKEAVVISKKVQVYSGPSETLPVLFYIHEGHELHVKREKASWSEVELSNGFKGWLKNEELFKI